MHHPGTSVLNHRRERRRPFVIRHDHHPSRLSLSLLLREATGAFPIGYGNNIIIVVLRRASSYWIAMCSASSVYQRAFRETSFQIGKGLVLPQTFHHG